MNPYLEIPDFDAQLPIHVFLNDGMGITYPHWHQAVEFIYARHGVTNIGIADKIIPIEEGEIYFFDSGALHYFLSSPESDRIVLQFDLKLFNETIMRSNEKLSLFDLFAHGEQYSAKWPLELTQEVTRIMQGILTEGNHDSAGKYYAINGLLFELIADLYRELPLSHHVVPKDLDNLSLKYQASLTIVNQIFSYVENHYQEPITLEEVAKEVGFSTYYFTKFFKMHTGKTFFSFLNEYRINYSKFLLANEKLPMGELAFEAGFTSTKNFYHVFKKLVGVAPLKYQNQLLTDGSVTQTLVKRKESNDPAPD